MSWVTTVDVDEVRREVDAWRLGPTPPAGLILQVRAGESLACNVRASLSPEELAAAGRGLVVAGALFTRGVAARVTSVQRDPSGLVFVQGAGSGELVLANTLLLAGALLATGDPLPGHDGHGASHEPPEAGQ